MQPRTTRDEKSLQQASENKGFGPLGETDASAESSQHAYSAACYEHLQCNRRWPTYQKKEYSAHLHSINVESMYLATSSSSKERLQGRTQEPERFGYSYSHACTVGRYIWKHLTLWTQPHSKTLYSASKQPEAHVYIYEATKDRTLWAPGTTLTMTTAH